MRIFFLLMNIISCQFLVNGKEASFNFADSINDWITNSDKVRISIPGEDGIIASGGPVSGKALKVTFHGEKNSNVKSPFIKVETDELKFSILAISEFQNSHVVFKLECVDSTQKELGSFCMGKLNVPGNWNKVEENIKLPNGSKFVRIVVTRENNNENGSVTFGDVFVDSEIISDNAGIETGSIKIKLDKNAVGKPSFIASDEIKPSYKLNGKDFFSWNYISPNKLDAEVSLSKSLPLYDDISLKIEFSPLASPNNGKFISIKPAGEKPIIKNFDTISMWLLGTFLHIKKAEYNIKPVISFVLKDSSDKNKIFKSGTSRADEFTWHSWAPLRIHLDKTYNDMTLEEIRIENLNYILSEKNKNKLCFYINDIKFYEKKCSEDKYSLPPDISSTDDKYTFTPGVATGNKILQDGSSYIFHLNSGENIFRLEYTPETGTIGDFKLSTGRNEQIKFADGANFRFVTPEGRRYSSKDSNIHAKIKNIKINQDCLDAEWIFYLEENPLTIINYLFKIHENSLVVEVSSKDGNIDYFSFGNPLLSGAKGINIPYLVFQRGMPNLFLWKEGLFSSHIWDWKNSNSSKFTGNESIYLKKTDNTLNPLKERIVFNFSRDINKVFPNITNPSSPYKKFLKKNIMFKIFSYDFDKILLLAELCKNYGMSDLMLSLHGSLWNARCARGGEMPWAQSSHVDPKWGNDTAFTKFCDKIHQMGYSINVFDDYVTSQPLSPYYRENDLAISSDNKDIFGWFGTPQIAPIAIPVIAKQNAKDLKDKYNIDSIYSDQYTAQQYYNRNDYDHRKPGAGLSNTTFLSYANAIIAQKEAINGPIISEGGYQWFLSGFLDANYGTLHVPGERWKYPIIVDFKLLKIQPLEATLGMGPGGWTFDMQQQDFEYPSYKGLDRFIATSLAYGNAAVFYPPYVPTPQEKDSYKDISLNENWHSILRYYFLYKTVQPKMLFEEIDSIQYWIDGKYMNLSEAIVKDENLIRKVKVVYKNGLTIFSNCSLDEKDSWEINMNNKKIVIPAPGFLVLFNGDIISASILIDGTRIDYATSDNYIYFDGRTNLRSFNEVKGEGQIIILKYSDFCKVILRNVKTCEINTRLLGKRKIKKVIPIYDNTSDILIEDSSLKINSDILIEDSSLKINPPFVYKIIFDDEIQQNKNIKDI